MVLNSYVTGETLPVEWQVYKLAGSDTGVPIGTTQYRSSNVRRDHH